MGCVSPCTLYSFSYRVSKCHQCLKGSIQRNTASPWANFGRQKARYLQFPFHFPFLPQLHHPRYTMVKSLHLLLLHIFTSENRTKADSLQPPHYSGLNSETYGGNKYPDLTLLSLWPHARPLSSWTNRKPKCQVVWWVICFSQPTFAQKKKCGDA